MNNVDHLKIICLALSSRNSSATRPLSALNFTVTQYFQTDGILKKNVLCAYEKCQLQLVIRESDICFITPTHRFTMFTTHCYQTDDGQYRFTFYYCKNTVLPNYDSYDEIVFHILPPSELCPKPDLYMKLCKVIRNIHKFVEVLEKFTEVHLLDFMKKRLIEYVHTYDVVIDGIDTRLHVDFHLGQLILEQHKKLHMLFRKENKEHLYRFETFDDTTYSGRVSKEHATRIIRVIIVKKETTLLKENASMYFEDLLLPNISTKCNMLHMLKLFKQHVLSDEVKNFINIH